MTPRSVDFWGRRRRRDRSSGGWCCYASQNIVVVTSRGAIHVFEADTLALVDTGYRDSVEQKPFTSCDVSPDGTQLAAVSSQTSAGFANVYFFTRHLTGSMQLKVTGGAVTADGVIDCPSLFLPEPVRLPENFLCCVCLCSCVMLCLYVCLRCVVSCCGRVCAVFCVCVAVDLVVTSAVPRRRRHAGVLATDAVVLPSLCVDAERQTVDPGSAAAQCLGGRSRCVQCCQMPW